MPALGLDDEHRLGEAVEYLAVEVIPLDGAMDVGALESRMDDDVGLIAITSGFPPTAVS